MGTTIESSWENRILAEENQRLRDECSAWRLAHARAESLVCELMGMIDEHDQLATGHHPREWSDWLRKARSMLATTTQKVSRLRGFLRRSARLTGSAAAHP